MREIKFRAYLTTQKKMVYFDLWDHDCDHLDQDCDFDPKTDVVMQYTGLKDKNGKEIYEGDVIAEEETAIHDGDTFKNTDKFINVRKVENYKYFVGDIGTRWFGQRKHQVLWAADSCGFEPFSDSTNNCGHCGGGKSSNDVEVIGNIYENPELCPTS